MNFPVTMLNQIQVNDNVLNLQGSNNSDQFHADIDNMVFPDSFELLPAVDPSMVHMVDNTDMTKIETYERGPPDRNIPTTPFNFVVEVNSTHTDKKNFLYSHKLNRIYVDMNTDFSVQFNWSGSNYMYVRAMVVFADTAQAEKRVERCTSHYHDTVNTVSPVVAKNVLHSSRGSSNSSTVQYCGQALEADSWLSVRVALTKPGPEPVTHAFRFKCKNSCTSGINRRAIAIIFTLEDHLGCVYGRQIVGARVCACPKRDMLRDEGDGRAGKRRLNTNTNINTNTAPDSTDRPAAKIKIEDCDDALIHLRDIQLLSPAAAVLGLESMIKMEEQALESRRDNTRATALRVITQLKQTQREIKRKYNVQ